MFVATASLTAQTYNGGTWYSLYDANEHELKVTITSYQGEWEFLNMFPPVQTNLTFDAMRSPAGKGTLNVAPIVNGVQQPDIFSSNPGKQTSSFLGVETRVEYVSYSATVSNSNSNQIKFYTPVGATLSKHFKNIKLPLAKHILLYDDTDSKGMDYGTSSIGAASTPRHLVNLATAEGQTSTSYYTIKFRSFLATGDITITSSNPEFHFGNGKTSISLGVANNYCASANGSGNCSATTLGQISNYNKQVYFSPSIKYNKDTRSTTIKITDGTSTAYIYLSAPVIPTYFFKAAAIASPAEGGNATATFPNGQNTYSLVATDYATASMSAKVTFTATPNTANGYVFEGWKKVAEDTYYKQGSGTESFKETITSSVLDPRGMASQKTYRAIFSERYTASMETNDISGLKVGGSATAVYSFINTSAAIPSSDENADFHYVITHRPDNTTKNGSADASKVVSFDPSTKQVVGLNSGSATITFVQKQNATHEYVAKSFEVTVEKNAIDAWIVRGDAVLNELVENAFSVTDGLQDYSVESLNSSIAEYVAGNKIQTYFTEGTAQFRVTRDEDYKYVGLNELFDLEVKKSGDVCYLVENASTSVDHEFGQNSNGTYSEVYTLNGIGDKLNFMCKLSDNADAEHYLVAQYSTSDTGDFYDLTGSYVSTKKDNEHVLNGLTLPEGTKRIRFKRTAQTIGTKNFSIYNIYVTRKKELDHQVAGNGLVLDPVNIGQISQKSFNLKWSTCADEIVLVSDKDLFELNTTSINASNGGGNTNIQVTFKGSTTPGVYQAFISVYDRTQVEHLTVTCEVKDKLNTTIHYTGAYQYSEGHDCLTGLFYVQDEVPNVVEGALVKLSSSNEDILEICEDRTSFIPHCGGQVTLTAKYAGNEIYAPAEWSREITVANCYQTINWEQDFRQFIAAEDGTISQRIELTAKADPTDFAITYELDEAAQKFASLENQNGQWFLVISGVGTGHIIANSPAGTFETKYYDEASLMYEIRVHKWGEKCNTDSIVTSHEVTLSDVLAWWPIETEFELDGRPYARMEFYSHVSNESWYNDLTVSFSTDEGATWTNSKTFYDIPNTYNWNTPYVHDNIPEGANRVKFRTNSTTNTYFNMVKMVQKTYLEPNVTEIRIDDAIVNKQFSREFKVKYSDIPLLQYVISDSHDLGLKLTSTPPVANDCGDWGEYTFILTGESPYPQKNVTETITFSTSAGDIVNIPVTITANLSDTYYFNQAGNWGDLNNWQVNGATPTELPTASNPVVISEPLTINKGELVAYGVTIENGGSVNIQPKGGLTLHAGGFTNVTENNFEVHNNLEGAGFVRVSKYFKERGGTMPKMKVRFTTKANMKNGGNKDAAWQYIGAPGAETQMQVVNTSTLYLRSEEKGWVRQWDSNASLTPFAGYAFTQKDQPSIDFTPRLVTDNQTITLTYTEGGMKGDNLWANSYMAPIDIKKLGKEDFSGAVDQTVYLYNCGSWNEWNKDQSSIKTAEEQPGRYYAIPVGSARALDAAYDQTVIPPMQGVYMKANLGGGSLTLNYEKHVWNCKSNEMNRALRIAGKRTAEEDYLSSILRIRLQINSQNSGADRMYLIQDSTCTADYDNGFDAPKQMTDGLLNLYTNEACGKMEISATDNIDGIYLGFAAGEDEVYTMTFTSLIGEDLYLYDVEQDTLISMANGEIYEFAAVAKSTNDMRFQILVNPDLSDYLPNGGNGDGVTTDIYDVQTQQLWVQDKKVYIAYASANSTLEVYTISGVAVAKYAIGYAPCTLDLSNMPTGVYMLRLNDTVYKFVCK